MFNIIIKVFLVLDLYVCTILDNFKLFSTSLVSIEWLIIAVNGTYKDS